MYHYWPETECKIYKIITCVYYIITKFKKKKKLSTSAYELRKKNSSVFITHYIECNLSTERQQARNLGQAVEYAAWTQIV